MGSYYNLIIFIMSLSLATATLLDKIKDDPDLSQVMNETQKKTVWKIIPFHFLLVMFFGAPTTNRAQS